jgi:uncharacterized membrane protein
MTKTKSGPQVNNQSKKKKPTDLKGFILQQLKLFGIVFLIVVLASGIFGYSVAGWEGAQNGALWGVVMMAMALPVMGIFILARYWGDFAGRWGSARRGEDKPDNQEEEDLPPFKFD